MDYKNQGQGSRQKQAFFTAGAGSTPLDKNNFGPENLNSTTWSAEAPKRFQESAEDQKGNDPSNIPNAMPPNTEATSDLGESIDAILPPNMQALPVEPTPIDTPVFNEKLILTKGDRIYKKALPEINHLITNFNRTGNAAGFYALVRGDKDHPGMVGSNLKNSYNRELG